MACCGSRKNRSVRKQTLNRPQTKNSVSVQRVERKPARKRTVNVGRQHVVQRPKCHSCGYPAMAVNIAGRERLQCTNPNCRIILK